MLVSWYGGCAEEIRRCTHLCKLKASECVLREIHPLPKVLAQLSGGTVFSKLDANSGFWQIPLDPSGRATSQPSLPHLDDTMLTRCRSGYQVPLNTSRSKRGKILAGLEGVVCLMDDVLSLCTGCKRT